MRKTLSSDGLKLHLFARTEIVVFAINPSTDYIIIIAQKSQLKLHKFVLLMLVSFNFSINSYMLKLLIVKLF